MRIGAEKPWLSVAQAAKALNLSTVRVYGLIKEGKLRTRKELMLTGREIIVVSTEEVLGRKASVHGNDVMAQVKKLQRLIEAMAWNRGDAKKRQQQVQQALGLVAYLRSYIAGRR